MGIFRNDELNELGTDAVKELKDYFRSSDDSKGKKADAALKVLGRINGSESNRLKAFALELKLASMIGLKGAALHPILADLMPDRYPARLDGKPPEEPAA